MRILQKSSGLVVGLILSMLVANAPLAATEDGYQVSVQISKHSVIVSNPTIETTVGKEVELSLTGLGAENDYKLLVKIERILVENGNKTADVALNLFLKQNDEWSLVTSPTLSTKIGGVTEFSISEPSSRTDIGFRLQVTPLNTPLDIALNGMPDDYRMSDDASVQKVCVTCGSGATMCCSGGCCSDAANDCPRICDE